MFLFFFCIQRPISYFTSSSLALPLYFLISFLQHQGCKKRTSPSVHHLHSAHQAQTFTTPPCSRHTGSCLVGDGKWSKGGREEKERVWEEEKPGLASYIVSLDIRIESGREVGDGRSMGGCMCVFLLICNKYDSQS